MRKVTVIVCGLLFSVAAMAVRADGSANAAQQRVNSVVAQLQRSEIQRVEILAIPGRIESPIAIGPSDIASNPDYRLVVRDIRQGLLKGPLSRALTSLTVDSASEVGDIRWGVLFFDTHGQRIAGIFFDRDGKRGMVDSLPVSAGGQLVKWLNEMFSKCLP